MNTHRPSRSFSHIDSGHLENSGTSCRVAIPPTKIPGLAKFSPRSHPISTSKPEEFIEATSRRRSATTTSPPSKHLHTASDPSQRRGTLSTASSNLDALLHSFKIKEHRQEVVKDRLHLMPATRNILANNSINAGDQKDEQVRDSKAIEPRESMVSIHNDNFPLDRSIKGSEKPQPSSKSSGEALTEECTRARLAEFRAQREKIRNRQGIKDSPVKVRHSMPADTSIAIPKKATLAKARSVSTPPTDPRRATVLLQDVENFLQQLQATFPSIAEDDFDSSDISLPKMAAQSVINLSRHQRQ
jgi:hypothetical protein